MVCPVVLRSIIMLVCGEFAQPDKSKVMQENRMISFSDAMSTIFIVKSQLFLKDIARMIDQDNVTSTQASYRRTCEKLGLPPTAKDRRNG